MKKISRRNFLKVTAAGAVGAAALSLTGCGGSKDNGTTASSTAASGAESKGYNLAAVDSSKNTEVVLWHNRGGKAGELLEQTIAYDEGTEVGETACQTLNTIVGTALSEAQIESLVIAKGYDDCVTYINDGVVCVAVSAPADGLSDADAALISDIVTSQTDYSLSQVRIIEVKP